MSKTYHIHTFGCQMNVADSGHVAAQLEALGYQPVLQPDAADVIVVNTCVVRQSAEDKAIGKLGALLPIKRRKPDAVIGLMGCMVGVKPSPALASRFPWVDVFMPPSEPGPLIGYLMERDLAGEARAVDEAEVLARYALQDNVEPLPPARQLPGRTKSVLQSVRHLTQASGGQSPVAAHVPIVYGCSHACTFCIIPFRRGVERSRPLEEIVAEVRDLVAQGVREVTLLGQIVDRYGYDFPGQRPDLADLLRAVHAVDGLWRIRFLTSHPSYMSDRILHAMRDLPKVCEHVEVPIQAGDDQVLEAMRRGYSSDDYRRLVSNIREILPTAAVHTDIIVGFPGESDAQFQRTYDTHGRRRAGRGQGRPPQGVGGLAGAGAGGDHRTFRRRDGRGAGGGCPQGQVAGPHPPEQAGLFQRWRGVARPASGCVDYLGRAIFDAGKTGQQATESGLGGGGVDAV